MEDRPPLGVPKHLIAGLILAGGRSSRFGREKAVADLGGEPLIARVRRVLARGCSMVAVSAPDGSAAATFAAAHGLPCLPDGPFDLDGPLAGVKAGLRRARSQGFAWLATAPCDAPFLPIDLVEHLHAGRQVGGAVVDTSEGLQPLCALWPSQALESLKGLDHHPPIRSVLQRIGAAVVRFDDAEAFANLNTPEDYARAKMRRA